MNILEKVSEQLRKEFPLLGPDIIKAVIWAISGGIEKKTFEQVSDEIIGKGEELSDPKEREQFIYEIILERGRKNCEDKDIINMLKENIAKARDEVRTRRLRSIAQSTAGSSYLEAPVSSSEKTVPETVESSSKFFKQEARGEKRDRDTSTKDCFRAAKK